MPITLNHSNIGVQYNTGSNYIIETVKSDLYIGNEIYNTIVSDNIQAAPVTPSIYIENSSGNVYAVESYTYTGSANTADYTRVFTKNTVCDILVVGGGGAGGRRAGGGGGAGALLYHKNQILNGTYNIKVGKGGRGVFFSEAQAINNGRATNDTSGYNGEDSQFIKSDNTKEYLAKGGAGGYGGGGSPNNTGGSAGGGNYTPNATSLLTSLNKFNNSIVNIISNSTYDNTGLTYPEGCYGRRGGIQVNNYKGGGGGGAGGAGMNHAEETTVNDGYGGLGLAIDITGTPVIYAGGGNGSDNLSNISQVFDPSYPTIQSRGGGGFGSDNGIPENGLDGTGGGGGGQGSDTQTSGAGGSGIVIIRYLLATIPTNNLLTAEPTVSPNIHSDAVIETYLYTTGTSATNYTKVFSRDTLCDILIVAGGGGGGSFAGGGGGAGGLIYLSNINIQTGTYSINVGKGGAPATNGGNSTFGSLYTAIGGGSGASMDGSPSSGGSGGGGNRNSSTNGSIAGQPGGSGTLNQGNAGGTGKNFSGSNAAGGGGGGAGAAGDSAFAVGRGANGGIGRVIDITGTSIYYAGGGGGGSGSDFNTAGTGGLGGGGNGAIWANTGGNASANTGGGGGGGSAYPGDGRSGGSGGSGIVIIRYRSLAPAPNIINMNKTLTFNYYPSLSPTIYTLTFPTKTIASINNSGNKILDGSYTITLGNTLSTIVPTQNQNFQDKTHFSPTISIRYNLLNPVLDSIGAQWTYNTSNTNVYHMGSVGIGTTIPEYSLDVRGTIYSSLGGYTSSALTKWSVLSDRRIKENIVKASYDKCLENVKNIELYNFNFKDNCVNTNDRHQLGFIAQEVQQVYPKAVEVSKMILNLEEKIDDLLTLNITQIDYTLYGAVKSLIEKMENIKIKMEQIKTAYDIP